MDNLVEKTLEIDPVVDLDYNDKPEDVVFKGCTEKTVYPIGASNFTDANIGFQNISPASLTTVTDREFRIKYTLRVAVSFPTTSYSGNYPFTNAVVGTIANAAVVRAFPTNNAGGALPNLPAYVAGQLATDPIGSNGAGALTGDGRTTFCLRAYPLQSALSSLELFLNGQSVSIPQNDLICLQQYLMSDEENQYAVTYPCQRENSALYKTPDGATYVTQNGVVTVPAIPGSAAGAAFPGVAQRVLQVISAAQPSYKILEDLRNPMSMNTMNTNLQSRGSFLPILEYEAVAANVCYRVYRYDLCESLAISPLVWANVNDVEGLANIVNISMNLTVQNLNRTFSRVPNLIAGSTFQAHLATFDFNGQQFQATQPQFIPLYLSQDPVLSARQGSNIFYDYDRLLVDANSNAIGTACASNSADATWNGNALRSNIIPDDIIVYIKPRKGTTDETNPDNFLRIKALTVAIGNRSNVFASFTEEDLWRMSCKNGIRLSWHEWRYTVGSIIKINVAKDIGLVSDEAAGITKFTMIKVDGTYSCSNLAYSQANGNVFYDVMTVLVANGKAIVSPNSVQYMVGGVSSSDVLALTADKQNVVASGLRRQLSTRGGSMFGSVGRLLQKGLRGVRDLSTADNAEKVSNMADLASNTLSGLGIGGSVAGGRLVRGKHKRVV